MKRFYKNAAARAAAGGFEILLDERPVKTPARNPLLVPGEALASTIADEWNAQGEKVEPRSMPLTGLANAAIDRIAPDRDNFVRALAVYGETDLLCYRAEGPASLAAAQSAAWDPLLEWARRRYDVEFEVVRGIMHRDQPAETIRRLTAAVDGRTSFELAALTQLVTIAGSLVAALALAEGSVDIDTAWAAASLDEAWQAEQWGKDAEAARVLEARRQDFAAAYRFLNLL